MPPRRRLTPDQRRDQLLDAGEHLFATRSFDELSMTDIAEVAGVTRALLYHYFRTKAEYFGAVWSRAHRRIGAAATDPPPSTVRAAIAGSLASYLDFYAAHLPLVLIANRSPIALDPAVRGPIEQNFAALCTWLLDAAGTTGHDRALAEVAFAGWITLVRETTIATLLDHRITPEENLALCLAALDATVGAHADLAAPLADQA